MGAGGAENAGGGDIEVVGYSARYLDAFRHLMDAEGSSRFTDDPVDPGGATKWGISLRFLAAEGAFDADGDGRADFDLDMDGDIDGADIRALTEADAKVIYLRCFWQPLAADRLPRPLGEALFDQAVNGGRSAASKLLQRAVNTCIMTAQRAGTSNGQPRIAVDGAIGPGTLQAVGWVLHHPQLGMPAMIATLRDAAKERYRAIVRANPSQQRFLKGWLARADALGRFS